MYIIECPPPHHCLVYNLYSYLRPPTSDVPHDTARNNLPVMYFQQVVYIFNLLSVRMVPIVFISYNTEFTFKEARCLPLLPPGKADTGSA